MSEYKYVPVEATDEMIRAASPLLFEPQRPSDLEGIYRTMIESYSVEQRSIQLPENEVHKRLKTFLTKRDQGRVMGVLREFGILYNPRDATK